MPQRSGRAGSPILQYVSHGDEKQPTVARFSAPGRFAWSCAASPGSPGRCPRMSAADSEGARDAFRVL